MLFQFWLLTTIKLLVLKKMTVDTRVLISDLDNGRQGPPMTCPARRSGGRHSGCWPRKSENEFLPDDDTLPDFPERVVTQLSSHCRLHWCLLTSGPGLAGAAGLVLAQEQVRDRTQ